MALLALGLPLLASCYAGGNGSGTLTGVVSAPACSLDPAAPFTLELSYFQFDPTEDFLEILAQHDADQEVRSDMLSIVVVDAPTVKTSRLGQPIAIDLSASDGVAITLSLNETCPFERDDDEIPVVYAAVSGTITFSSLYFPDVDDGKETAAVLTDVRFEDPNRPSERFAVLSGAFQATYSRRAQREP